MTPVAGKSPRALIYAMMALVMITLLLAYTRYRDMNDSVDPRIVPARQLYEGYNALASSNDYEGVIRLLDTIGQIYNRYPHYRRSFETGVLENNRAAVYLTLGLSYDSLSSPYHYLGPDSLIACGERAVRNSIAIYEDWLACYEGRGPAEIREQIGTLFGHEPDSRDPDEVAAYVDNRVREIEDALKETPRRLSVAYTNLGLVYRYREDYATAASCYQKAIRLWEENLTAENNLNILLGNPLKKRNFLQKMFPKSK
jgi:tetratricopeptide (TPR) repeat protein